MRTTLIPAETGSIIVLTFAHQITDGTGGMRVVADLVAALDGGEEGGRPPGGGMCRPPKRPCCRPSTRRRLP